MLAIDFCPDGVRVATGSEDHSVRIWDLRKRAAVYVIPGHRSLVSQVRWAPDGGHWLLTASYDCVAKVSGPRRRLDGRLACGIGVCWFALHPPTPTHLHPPPAPQTPQLPPLLLPLLSPRQVWSARDYKLLRTLAGHEGKVMGADVSPQGDRIATCSYDRTLKMWQPEFGLDLDMLF